MSIRRYLVLVVTLVSMGLGTVWYKHKSRAMGYEVVQLEKALQELNEEEMVVGGELSALTALNRMTSKIDETGLVLNEKKWLESLKANHARRVARSEVVMHQAVPGSRTPFRHR